MTAMPNAMPKKSRRGRQSQTLLYFPLAKGKPQKSMVSKATKKTSAPALRMSDAAVKAKTGKTWKEWFSILDKAGAKKLSHKEIVKYVNTEQGVGPWWQQMITATYEQQRGLRAEHEKPTGFEISVSRTVAAPVPALYEAFGNTRKRAQWLQEEGLVERTAVKNKSMRVTWNDQKTILAISFLPKGEGKSQIVVQHGKLPNARSAAKMKKYWGEALDRLRALIEK
jgi:uncharacterized protein YndB with AHSA1/START domain